MQGASEEAPPCAEVTVTFQYPKPGQLTLPGQDPHGPPYCARDRDRAAPAPRRDRTPSASVESDVRALLPPRPADARGSFGRAGIVAGSMGMAGAGVMCARAALKAGRWASHALFVGGTRARVPGRAPELDVSPAVVFRRTRVPRFRQEMHSGGDRPGLGRARPTCCGRSKPCSPPRRPPGGGGRRRAQRAERDQAHPTGQGQGGVHAARGEDGPAVRAVGR